MIMALLTKNKLSFIDGSIIEPKEDYPNHGIWICWNHIVLFWVLNFVIEESQKVLLMVLWLQVHGKI